MNVSSQERLDVGYRPESSAQLILEVAKAAASHLELAAVLESLMTAIKPVISFHALAVYVIEEDYVRLHSLHADGYERRPGEPVASVLARIASSLNVPPKPLVRHPLSEHHVGEVASTGKPYVCTDL